MLARREGVTILALWAMRQLPPQLIRDLWTTLHYEAEAQAVDQETPNG